MYGTRVSRELAWYGVGFNLPINADLLSYLWRAADLGREPSGIFLHLHLMVLAGRVTDGVPAWHGSLRRGRPQESSGSSQ